MKRSKLVTIQKEYKVLSANSLGDELKELLEAQIKALGTGVDAVRFAAREADWSYTNIGADPIYGGHVGILCYKGIDVALFYHRQTITVKPDQDGVVNAAPPKALRSEAEAWSRVSLLETKSSYHQAQFYGGEFERLKTTCTQQENLIASLRRELEAYQSALSEKDKELEIERKKKVGEKETVQKG